MIHIFRKVLGSAFKRLMCRHYWVYSRSRGRLYCLNCKATRRVP
jgi:hypothetical protein